MISEKLLTWMKTSHVRSGDARVFGKDSDIRRGMDDDQAVKRFAEVWANVIEPELRKAEQIPMNKAKETVDDKIKGFVLDGHQYRQISIHDAVFVARLDKDATTNGICDQLWSIGAHRDTTRLCAYFRTVEEKEFFDRLAKDLKYEHPRDLALELLMDFLRKFPEFDAIAKAADAKLAKP